MGQGGPSPGAPIIGLDAAGPAARLWRNVYAKAAQAAEARLRALLAEHVYHRHSRRALVVVLDGGDTTLTNGTKADLELPWAFQVEGWALYAPAAGNLTVDLQYGATPAAHPFGLTTICGTTPPALAGEVHARSETLTGWTTALPRGGVLRVEVVSGATVLRATLTLFVRAV